MQDLLERIVFFSEATDASSHGNTQLLLIVLVLMLLQYRVITETVV